MKINYEELSEITQKTVTELKTIYTDWCKKKTNPSMPDLNLLSQLSGLSTASVSHFINRKRGKISQKNQDKLEKIINLVGYQPSHAAKRLRSIQKKSIGFVSPLINSPNPNFYVEILKGVKEEASKLGYSIDIFDIEMNQEKTFFKKLPFIGLVDGIITASLDLDDELLKSIAEYNIPILNIYGKNRPTIKPVIGSIMPDTQILNSLMKHLFVDCGYKNPIMISLVPENHVVRNENIGIYTESLRSNGIKYNEDENLIYISKHSFSEGKKVYAQIKPKIDNYDVIVCLSDVVATAISRELDKDGKKIAVTGMDNSVISTLYDITTIDKKMYRTGQIAFEKLFYGIQSIMSNNEFPDYKEDVVPFELVLRSSSEDKRD